MFDENTRWFPFGDFTGFVVFPHRAEPERGLVDFVVKFEPHSVIPLHRHVCETTLLVVSGEHRIYEPDGSLHDIRTAGSHTVTPAGQPPHREGAGAEPCIVFYSIRSDQDRILEFLDDDHNLVAAVTISDIAAVREHVLAAGAAAGR